MNTHRAERFEVRNLDHLYAVVERVNGCDASAMLAVPLDISETGVKLRLELPLNFQECIKLILGSVEGPLRMNVSCHVAWLRLEWNGSWLVGCQFVPQLPSEVMDEMFSNGIIERRRFYRQPVQAQAVAKWQLQRESFGVRLTDISEAGFCIRCVRPAEVGQRIRIALEADNGAINVQGRVQWCTSVGAEFATGCEFLDRTSCMALRDALRLKATGMQGQRSKASP